MPSEAPLPEDLAQALAAAPAAGAKFETLSRSCRREYLQWIDEAKKPETRARRIQQTLEKLCSG